MDDQESGAVLAAFQRYAHAFGELDAQAAAAHFAEPAMMISPRGVVALPDTGAVQSLLALVMVVALVHDSDAR